MSPTHLCSEKKGIHLIKKMTIMKRINLFIAAVFLTGGVSAQNGNVQTQENFDHPESIVARKKHMYVSNVGKQLDPMSKDGDGYISKLNRKTGEIEQMRYIDGLNSPKGMYVKCNTLYIADVDKVVGYNLKTNKKVFEKDFSTQGVTYLNDITRARRGVYVTSTDKNMIFQIRKNGKMKEVVLKNGNLNNINGIYRRPWGRAFVANFGTENSGNGSVGRFGAIRRKYKTIKNGGINDGLMSRMGKLYITDWVNKEGSNGRVLVYNKWNKKVKSLELPVTIGGPSDLYVDRRYRKLWIPSMTENKIVGLKIKDLKMSPKPVTAVSMR